MKIQTALCLAWLAALRPVSAWADAAASEQMLARFQGDERWMLNTVLSDPDKRKAFDDQAGEAVQGGANGQDVFLARWRSQVAAFARWHAQYLRTNDINPDADTVEQMVSPEEKNIDEYWLASMTPAEQKEYKDNLSDADDCLGCLGLGRGTIVKKVRAGRVLMAEKLEAYANSAEVKVAEEAVKAAEAKAAADKNALEQLKKLDEAAKNAAKEPSPEKSTQPLDEKYSGGLPAPPAPVPAGGAEPPAPAPAPSGGSVPGPGNRQNLTLQPPTAGSGHGGFKVVAPPNSVLPKSDGSSEGAKSGIMSSVVSIGAGALLGGILGFLLGGPIGAFIGAAVGGFAGYGAGKLIGR